MSEVVFEEAEGSSWVYNSSPRVSVDGGVWFATVLLTGISCFANVCLEGRQLICSEYHIVHTARMLSDTILNRFDILFVSSS